MRWKTSTNLSFLADLKMEEIEKIIEEIDKVLNPHTFTKYELMKV